MVKKRLLDFLADMEGPSSFPAYRHLLAADVIRFPDDQEVPRDPVRAYGDGWHANFRLPKAAVGIEDSKSLIIFEDTTDNVIGLDAERRFLFVLPLPCPPFPVDFYVAWGRCQLFFTADPQRLHAVILKDSDWFVGRPESEFLNGEQMVFTRHKCESMIGPGVTTAFEQLAFLGKP